MVEVFQSLGVVYCLFITFPLLTCTLSVVNKHAAPAPIDERVSQLLSQMSLSDKASQLVSAHSASPTTIYGIVDYEDVTSSCSNNITCRILLRNKFQKIQMNASSNSLNIPVSFRIESLHSSGPGGTIFPSPILLGSTWNKTLMNKIGETIAFESRMFGIDLGYSPVLQILSDPRFGRYTESYGGDPLLVSLLGYYMSLGLNGNRKNMSDYIDEYHISNEAKHFICYARGGKDGLPCDISERTLREVYLRPWEAFIASGGKSIMASHNSVNGVPMHANHYLLTDVLRKEYNWAAGLIGSDCADIVRLYARGGPWSELTGFHIAADMNSAVLKSLNSGLDYSLCDDIRENVINLTNSKQLNTSVLDRAVSNMLHLKFANGLFDEPLVNVTTSNIEQRVSKINNDTAKILAKEAALQGIVLLKNKYNILPLNVWNSTKSHKNRNRHSSGASKATFGFIGPMTNLTEAYYGPYTNTGASIETLLDVFQQNGVATKTAQGCFAENLTISDKLLNEAIDVANSSDYVILMVGDSLTTIGENIDRVGLDLPGGELYLMNKILSIKPNNTIVIYFGGRPATFGTSIWNMYISSIYLNDEILHNKDISNNIKSQNIRDNSLLFNKINVLISTYHPGEQGGSALFDIIFGMFNPVGRLTTSWPQSSSHVNQLHSSYLKLYQGHENMNYVYNTIDPLFPFGFGLSYYNDSLMVHDKMTIVEKIANCQWIVNINITNKTPMDSYHIIQIYFTKWVSDVVRYELELAGFEQVFIKTGETIEANVIISADTLSYYDSIDNEWILESGEYYIYDGLNVKDYNYWDTQQIIVTDSVKNPCKVWDNL